MLKPLNLGFFKIKEYAAVSKEIATKDEVVGYGLVQVLKNVGNVSEYVLGAAKLRKKYFE